MTWPHRHKEARWWKLVISQWIMTWFPLFHRFVMIHPRLDRSHKQADTSRGSNQSAYDYVTNFTCRVWSPTLRDKAKKWQIQDALGFVWKLCTPNSTCSDHHSSNYNSHNWPIVVIIFRHTHFTVEVSAMVPMVPNVLPEVTTSFPICQKFREKRPGWQLEAPKAPEAPEVADGWCMLCTMTIRRPAEWSNGALNPLDSTGLPSGKLT